MADEMHSAEVQLAVTAALEEQKKKKKKKRLIIVGIIVALILVIGFAAGSGGDSGTATEPQTDAQGQTQKVEEKKNKGADGKLGDYVCTVKSATKCSNWDGKDSVKIVYEFTNNASSSQSFDTALVDHVYQDGIALETTFTNSDENEVWDVQIKPGVTKEVTKIYELRDSTTDLEIEVQELISFSDDKYTKIVKF